MYIIEHLKKIIYIEVLLINKVVLVSSVQQNDSVLYIYTDIHSFSDYFPI